MIPLAPDHEGVHDLVRGPDVRRSAAVATTVLVDCPPLVRRIADDCRSVRQHYFHAWPFTHRRGRRENESGLTVAVEHDVAGAEVSHGGPAAWRRNLGVEGQRLPLEPRHEIVGERDPLQGRAQHEFAGVEDEAAVVTDFDELGEVFLRELRVDERRRVVAEHAEVAVDAEIDG